MLGLGVELSDAWKWIWIGWMPSAFDAFEKGGSRFSPMA